MTGNSATTIIFLLFPGITQLDFTAPAQALSRMPGAVVAGAAATLDPLATDSVLNGIAWDAKAKRLFVTGKYWPKLYEIALADCR